MLQSVLAGKCAETIYVASHSKCAAPSSFRSHVGSKRQALEAGAKEVLSPSPLSRITRDLQTKPVVLQSVLAGKSSEKTRLVI